MSDLYQTNTSTHTPCVYTHYTHKLPPSMCQWGGYLQHILLKLTKPVKNMLNNISFDVWLVFMDSPIFSYSSLPLFQNKYCIGQYMNLLKGLLSLWIALFVTCPTARNSWEMSIIPTSLTLLLQGFAERNLYSCHLNQSKLNVCWRLYRRQLTACIGIWLKIIVSGT